MIRTKDIHGGRLPPLVDVYDEELEDCPGAGHVIAVGGPNVVGVPPELGGGFARIVEHSSLPACPNCKVENTTPVIETDRGLGVSCCTACGQYGWFRLPEKESEER